ncbi:Shikimate dehydrogenase [Gracilaria domingensis]|nr:Shikimate dehydrogenase [Gracilaria domingensis]
MKEGSPLDVFGTSSLVRCDVTGHDLRYLFSERGAGYSVGFDSSVLRFLTMVVAFVNLAGLPLTSPKSLPQNSRGRFVRWECRLRPFVARRLSPRVQKPQTTSTKICTSLTGATVHEQLKQAREAQEAGADLVEIRIDLLEESSSSQWERILEEAPLPTIVTNRAAWEGGNWHSSEVQRLQTLARAAQLGAQHIDVELRAIPLFLQYLKSSNMSLPLSSTKLIISYHDFNNSLTSEQIDQILSDMSRLGADVCKIAMAATSALDNCVVFGALQRTPCASVILAMGEAGQPSRILAPKYGSYLTFASVGAGSESAPGQIQASTLRQMYRFHEIKPWTPVYGVIGNPISQSMSPALHNAAMTASDIKGVFLAFKVEDHYPEFIRNMCNLGVHGFAVTKPGKEVAMEAMDDVDQVAKKIGAMNTVVRQTNGTLKGYNTDWAAAISAVEDHLDDGMNGKCVVCIGAGGAGKALAYGALEKGASKVIVVNRTKSKASELVRDLGERAEALSLSEFNTGVSHYDVLMNTTSVGMYPDTDDSPVSCLRLSQGAVIFDAVYNPELLRDAKKSGCVTVSGLEMFVRQAAGQFQLWFPNATAPVDVMRNVVLERLGA